MSNSKMFCLLFWMKEKSITVLEEPEDLKNINEGENVEMYINEKPYEAILLARSGNVKKNFIAFSNFLRSRKNINICNVFNNIFL